MIHEFTRRAALAVDRYGYFLNILRSQGDIAFRRGGLSDPVRQEAIAVSTGAARAFVNMEQTTLNEDTVDIARAAYMQARQDLGLAPKAIEDKYAEFIYSAAAYTTRLMAAQAERDVVALAQHMRVSAQRVDLYVRSGRHTPSSASAAVMLEDQSTPAFRFLDRLGRRFKSTKHIRDTYRAHLLNTYNEVYMDVVGSHGWEIVKVSHPDPNFKWAGQALAIVSFDDTTPLYYDVRDEVFHPSSDATITIL